MITTRLALAAVFFSTTATLPANAQQSTDISEISVESVSADIAQLEEEIAAAETEVSQYGGGLVQSLATARVETLKLTQAILQNRLAAQRGGAVVTIMVPSTSPDPARAAELLQEIEAQTAVIAQAESETGNGGGLIGALALSRVQTEKLTLATLRATWYQAQYGVLFPVAISANAPEPSIDAKEPLAADRSLSDAPEWADLRYPEIDYTRAIFQQLATEGFTLSGWWGILETRAELDDSPKVLAINFSAYKDGFQTSNPRLLVQCSEGAASVIYDADDYLLTNVRSDDMEVTYRIDDADAVSDRWSKLTSSKGAGLFQSRGRAMIRELYVSKQLFARIVERNGTRHDATFQLAGADKAFDAVAAACSFSTLALSSADYRSIQTMLNAAGFVAGTPDGVWGPGSIAAMRAYQEAEGLPATGAADRKTLNRMGLEF